MKLYKSYLEGNTLEVYNKIHELGNDIFLNSELFKEVEKILIETFDRVAYNLNIIYQELLSLNYLFFNDVNKYFEIAICKRFDNTELLLSRLKEAAKPFGHIPLSLEYFYRAIGGINFGWNYTINDQFIWNASDPIQIINLVDLVDEVANEYWREDLEEQLIEYNDIKPHMFLSADLLHKDNISGGIGYAIEITKQKSFDSEFLYEPHNTTFVNYLRICFDNCGFPLIKNNPSNNYSDFFEKVKPQLKAF